MIKPNKIVLFLLLAFFTLGMNIYTDTFLGGIGMIQTYNSITAVIITCLISLCFIFISLNKNVYISSLFKYLFLFSTAVLCSSILNANQPWDVILSVSCVALLGIGIFVVHQFEQEDVKKLLWILVIGISIQAVIGILQVHDLKVITDWTSYQYATSSYKVPIAIFRQVNVFGSFIVSGVAISLVLLLKYHHSKFQYLVLSSLLGIQTYAFFLVKSSRTAQLAMMIIGFLVATYFLFPWLASKSKIKCASIKPIRWLPLALGAIPLIIALSVTLTGNTKSDVLQIKVDQVIERSPDKALGSSVKARMAIYTITWDLVKAKIWTGHGYGSFTRAYEYHLVESGITKEYLGKSQLSHPHNIVLYLWAEGGILPVVTLFILVGAIISQLLKRGRTGILWLAALTPISLHLLTEAPFSMSVPHILLFSIILGGATYHARTISERSLVKSSTLAFGLAMMVVVSPYSILYGFRYSNLLTYSMKLPVHQQRSSDFLIEKGHFEGPLKYHFAQLRAERAFQEASQSNKIADFQAYIEQATQLEHFQPGKNLLANLALSYAKTGNEEVGRKYFNQLAYYYPNKLNWFGLIRYYGEPDKYVIGQ
ncbi:PglL family O-oligosaccharyltransferase [Vibrio rotiferianus]|uniref:PglL family O-oligosaccharyltransferase n=1 Tax=Vibrio rotiferianus TaxID=190895 RepID=UPI00155AE6C3|nr:Wzy polymerase domain-containing protein [Vibrio rotiferianus]